MSNTKTLWIVIGLLVVVNLGLLAFLWVNAPDKRGPGGPGEGKEILMERLEMDEGQREQYLAEWERHQAAISELRKELRREKDRFFSFEGEIDVEASAREIGELQAELDVATYRHFEKVRSFLDEGQREKFGEVFHELFGPRGGGKKGPPPGRGGPPH